MAQVLNTTTSASAASAAWVYPSPSSMPTMRSESCSFIWQPNVRTKYVPEEVIEVSNVAKRKGWDRRSQPFRPPFGGLCGRCLDRSGTAVHHPVPRPEEPTD